MLLDGHREIGAALDRGVVGDDHDVLLHHPADAADHAGGGRGIVVHAFGRQRGDFQEWRAGIEQGIDAFAREQLAAFGVPGAGLLATAARGAGQPTIEFGDEVAMPGGVVEEILRAGIELRGQRGHAVIDGAVNAKA